MTEERWMPGNKAELIFAIEREWNLLMDVIAKLDSEKMITADPDGLSAKDNLAHLAEWMKILMGHYMDKRRAYEVMGVAPEVTQDWDFEARNSLLFERNRHRSTDDVLSELKRVYAELSSRLNEMSFADLLKPRHPFDSAKRPLLEFVLRGTTRHFAEHRKTIEKYL